MRHFALAMAWFFLFAAVATAAHDRLLPGDQYLMQTLISPGAVWPAVIGLLASLPVWTALVIITVVGLLIWNEKRVAFLLVTSDVLGEAISLVLKELVNRPRPAGALLDDLVATSAFPSSHVVRVTVTLGIIIAALVWRRKSWRIPSIIVALAAVLTVGLARIASGDHWPSDALGGYVLSIALVETFLAVSALLVRIRAVRRAA